MPIVQVIGMFIVVAIMHFVATSFMGAKGGQFNGLFVPLACASVLMWIGIIPFIGPVIAFLAGLWLLVIAVVVVEHVYQIDRTKAIIVVAVPVAVAILISIIGFFLGLSTHGAHGALLGSAFGAIGRVGGLPRRPPALLFRPGSGCRGFNPSRAAVSKGCVVRHGICGRQP